MKSEFKILAAILLSLTMMVSCYEDKGNYDYIDLETIMPVEVLHIPDTTVKIYSYLTLEPHIEGMTNKEDYEYTWCAYGAKGGQCDTISREYMLDNVLIDLDLGDYTLTYMVRHKELQVAKYFTTEFHVVSEFSNGWFVLKEEDGYSDFDFIPLSGEMQSGLFEKANGYKLNGPPVKIYRQQQGFSYNQTEEDGTITTINSGAIHLMTGNDAATLEPTTMRTIYRGTELFYDPRTVISPTDYAFDDLFAMNGIAIINSGKLHSLSVTNYPLSKFASGAVMNDGTETYLYGEMLYNSFSGILVFDELKSRFLVGDFGPYALRGFSASDEEPFPSDMSDYEMVKILPRQHPAIMLCTAYAIMKEKATGDYKIFDISFTGYANNLFSGIFDVPAESRIPQATCMAAHMSSSTIYLSTGDNVLYSHTVSTYTGTREVVIHTFEDNEKIVFINEHKNVASWSPYDISLCVVTQNGNNWKLYEFAFNGSTSEIIEKPVFTCEGTGKAGYALKID